MSSPSSPVTRWLTRTSQAKFAAYAIVAAFTTYFCMYAFRKPFAAAEYLDPAFLTVGGVALKRKSVYVMAQVLGYCLSKFLGIKIISELPPSRRAFAILLCIAWAEGALLLFGLAPPGWAAFCLFLNGIPLGMVWGLVFGFLEGRRVSEPLGAGLSASYIVASGAVKAIGRALLGLGVSEAWMPFVTGLCFVPLMLVAVLLLRQLPPPTAEDQRLRTKREAMDKFARRSFVSRLFPGLFFLTLLYIFLTAYRDFRDNFAAEIWKALDYADTPSILATAELPIAFGVMLALAMLMLVKQNKRALVAVHLVMLAGTGLVGASTLLFRLGFLQPSWWMIAVGLGLYMAYVPYGCVLFDRMIAALGISGTAAFMIYVTDAFGYLGSVAVLLYRDLASPELSWLEFFVQFSYFTSAVCSVCFVLSLIYFMRVARSTELASSAGS
jgi:hypothetical protein